MNDEYGHEPDVPLYHVTRVSVVYNLKKQPGSDEPDDKYEEYDPLATVEAVAEAISLHGFSVSLCEQDDEFASRLLEQHPHFVANIAEGRGESRGREAQVPCFLESMGIPYWGSDALSMAVALDKLLTCRTLACDGIPVPLCLSFKQESDLISIPSLFAECSRFVVKPRYEGSSKGIFSDSIAHTPDEAEEKIRRIWRRYSQPALLEEYLPGDEITVGIVGNDDPSIVGMMRIVPAQKREEFLYSLEDKRNYLERIRYEGPESIPHVIRSQASSFALKAFKALELRDMARVDFRLDADGLPRIIDINPLPGLSPEYSDLPILHRLDGGEYGDLVKRILTAAFSRNRLFFPSPLPCR